MKLRGTWKGYQEGEFEVKNPLVGVEVGGLKGEKEDGREVMGERKGVLRVEYPEEGVGNSLMGMGKGKEDDGEGEGEVVVV